MLNLQEADRRKVSWFLPSSACSCSTLYFHFRPPSPFHPHLFPPLDPPHLLSCPLPILSSSPFLLLNLIPSANPPHLSFSFPPHFPLLILNLPPSLFPSSSFASRFSCNLLPLISLSTSSLFSSSSTSSPFFFFFFSSCLLSSSTLLSSFSHFLTPPTLPPHYLPPPEFPPSTDIDQEAMTPTHNNCCLSVCLSVRPSSGALLQQPG